MMLLKCQQVCADMLWMEAQHPWGREENKKATSQC